MHTLLALDHKLYTWIRLLPHTIPLDAFALRLSGIGAGGLIWIIVSIFLFFREEKKDHWFFLPVVSAALLCYVLAESMLKNFFARNRPPGAIVGDYSFPSSHATFAWALAVVLAAKEPRLKYLLYLLAFLISFSRIYLGVHYPSDVIAGSFLGIIIGWLSLTLENSVQRPR